MLGYCFFHFTEEWTWAEGGKLTSPRSTASRWAPTLAVKVLLAPAMDVEWWISLIAVILLLGHTDFLSLSFPNSKTGTQTLPTLWDLFFRVSCPDIGRCHVNVWGQSGVVEGWVCAWLWFVNVQEDGVETGGQEWRGRRHGCPGLGRCRDLVVFGDLVPCHHYVLWLEWPLLSAWSNRSLISQPIKMPSPHLPGWPVVWFGHHLGVPCSTWCLLIRLHTVFEGRLWVAG